MTEPVFFKPSRRITAGEIAGLTGAELVDAAMANVEIDRIAPADRSDGAALTFIEGRRNAGLAAGIRAAAVLCEASVAPSIPAGVAVLVTSRPQVAFAHVGRVLYPEAVSPGPAAGATGISLHAVIAENADIEDGASIEAGAVIGSGAMIGRGTVVAANAVIGAGCRIGRDGYVGPGASILCALIGDRVIIHGGARIGQDGFGYVPGRGGPDKVPQIGRVIIQDDVEIGANTTIDRGALVDTVVGERTKIDNGVQVAHNVRIGRSCLIAGLCGISGSVVIGDGVMLGGGVGVRDHVTIGSGAQLAGGAAVITDVPEGARWAGYPAGPYMDYIREKRAIQAMIKKTGAGEKRKDD